MSNSRLWRSWVLAGLVVWSFIGGLVWAAGSARQTGDKVFEMIPAKCLFCVRINNLDQALTQCDQFLTGISPTGVSMPVRAKFANLLGNPQLTGVNMAGSFVIFSPLLGSDAGAIGKVGILVPVADYKQFREGSPNVSPADEKGISKVMSDKAPPLLVMQVRNYALISPAGNENELSATAQAIMGGQLESLAGSLDADELNKAVNEPVWVYGDIQLVNKTFAPLLAAKIEEMKKTMEKMKTTTKAPMFNPTAIINMYATMIETFMKETKSLSLVVRPKPNVVSVTTTVSALPGTEMAGMFAGGGSSPEKNRLLGYLRDGAMMNIALNTGTPLWNKLSMMNVDLLAGFTGKAPSPEDAAKMKTLTADMIDCLGGPVACSISVDARNKPPLTVRYVIAIKDEKKFYRLMDQAAEMMNTGTIAELYKSLGMTISFTMKRGIDRYKGALIDSAKFAIKSAEPNSPEAQMLKAIYGEGIDERLAMVDGLCVMAVAADPNAAVRELIDQVKAGGPKGTSGEIRAALDLLPQAEKADFLATYNFLRLFQIAGAFMPMPIPPVEIPSKSNIVFAGGAGRGKLAIDVALPKEHLMEMVQLFQKMQQQQMQMQQQKGGEPAQQKAER